MEDVRELQRPLSVDVNYLGQMLHGKMASLGFDRTEIEQEIVPNLAFLYRFSIDLIQNVNSIIDSDPANLKEVWDSSVKLKTDIDHVKQTFLKFVDEPLQRFISYIGEQS